MEKYPLKIWTEIGNIQKPMRLLVITTFFWRIQIITRIKLMDIQTRVLSFIDGTIFGKKCIPKKWIYKIQREK